ncbi:unnamed protein product [Pleuronectes platessa]|uniref:Uncharacterized protein n=1 Tax=Pleuronectes platessa TaxID=8262 RepID=A0A9N7V5R7_PLEPL|nr:unnamed protein product [Pleuronectes platessa]
MLTDWFHNSQALDRRPWLPAGCSCTVQVNGQMCFERHTSHLTPSSWPHLGRAPSAGPLRESLPQATWTISTTGHLNVSLATFAVEKETSTRTNHFTSEYAVSNSYSFQNKHGFYTNLLKRSCRSLIQSKHREQAPWNSYYG